MLPVDEFNAKVQRIAVALFYMVTSEDEQSRYERRADLRSRAGDEGLRITNGEYAHRNRLVVRGHYPSDYKGRSHLSGSDNAPTITIAENKTAEAIVTDIKRRFLPAHVETLAKVRERNARWQEEEETKEQMLWTLAKALHVRDVRMTGAEWSVYFHRGSAKVYTGGDVEIKAYLPFDDALKVAILIGNLRVR